MIDWITVYVSLDHFSKWDQANLRQSSDRLVRFCPRTGDVRYETSAWDSVRSDSHQIVVRVTGSELWVQGSPARVIGDGDTIFSSGPSKAEDVSGCIERMIAFAYSMLEIRGKKRPRLHDWKLTRVDVTRHLLLDSLAEVRQYLTILRNAEGGRLKVNNVAGDTVYWNSTSRYRKAKAYAKGPQLRNQMKKATYTGCRYTEGALYVADRLARLELTIFKREWERNLKLQHWSELTPDVIDHEWHKQFDQMIGQTIMNDEELRNRIANVELMKKGKPERISEGQAKAAYMTWWAIQSMGYEMTRSNLTDRTWYRHLKILKLAGLTVTDLGNRKIIPFRVKTVASGHMVNSWSDVHKLMAA